MAEKTTAEEAPRRGRGWGSVLVVALVLAVGGVVLWQAGILKAGVSGARDYQAIFLTNNQVYFGKVANPNAQYMVLTDIYYLQVTQQLQPPTDRPVQNLQLVKLGNELHGPTDEMRINRDQILFIEDLKDDSNIVKTIRDFKAKSENK